jgi:hypothetical protein
MSEDDKKIADDIFVLVTMAFNQGRDQGRKDAIDEVLNLLRCKEGREYGYGTSLDFSDWLESKLKSDESEELKRLQEVEYKFCCLISRLTGGLYSKASMSVNDVMNEHDNWHERQEEKKGVKSD